MLIPSAPSPAAVGAADSPLDGYHDLWLGSVAHLMAEAEREVFLGLEREIFIRRFWDSRDGPRSGQVER